VTALVAPMCTNNALTPEQTERLLALVLDGLRSPNASGHAGGPAPGRRRPAP
jgi:hypothetical protein